MNVHSDPRCLWEAEGTEGAELRKMILCYRSPHPRVIDLLSATQIPTTDKDHQ